MSDVPNYRFYLKLAGIIIAAVAFTLGALAYRLFGK